MPRNMGNKSSVNLSLKVVRKQFNNGFCVAIEFVVFVFPLNTCRMSFFGFGPSTGYKILVCLILLFRVRVRVIRINKMITKEKML